MPSLIIDIAFELPEIIKVSLESRIRQMVAEPPGNLFFVQVKIASNSLVPVRVIGQVYRVTLCGVGGRSLPGVKEFLLFQTEQNEPLRLQYIQKQSDQINKRSS